MYFIGYDIGSSSIKVAIIDADSGKKLIVLHEPQEEMEIISIQNGWAEQNPKNGGHIYVKLRKGLFQRAILMHLKSKPSGFHIKCMD